MDQEFAFYLPEKEFGKILRKQRRGYLIALSILYLLLAADGVGLGLTIRHEGPEKWWFIALIPVLCTIVGILGFMGHTDGGVLVFGDCKAVFHPDGTLTVSGKHPSGFSRQIVGYEKTMKVTRAVQEGNYWILHGERRQWAIIPTSVPVPPELLHEGRK